MSEMQHVSMRWWPRQRMCVAVLVPLLVSVFAIPQPLPALGASVEIAVVQQAVRDRLERAAAGSRELFNRAPPEGNKHFAGLGLVTVIPEDEQGLRRARFPVWRDVGEYWRLRPWETAYRLNSGPSVPLIVTEDWPTLSDAPALRELLTDASSSVRGLAVEALGALGLPDDIRRIGALVSDGAIAAPGLARTAQQSSAGGSSTGGEDEPAPMVWSDRTVGAYARAAVYRMTGHRFDGRDANSLSFTEWLDIHDLGAESLWYWERRLTRERYAIPPLNSLTEANVYAFRERQRQQAAAYQAELRAKVATELERLRAEAQAKVFLLTDIGNAFGPTGPVNSFFPDGFALRIGRERILELLDGRNIWRDCRGMFEAKRAVLGRLARLAPTLLPTRDWPHVREQLEARIPSMAGTPVLISRLLPAAGPGQADSPQTREGYLRARLAKAGSDHRRQLIAAEMVRTNLQVQWPFLAAGFDPDKPVGRDERVGILQALAEPPHSVEKLRALVAFLDDPRNAPVLTRPFKEAADDQVQLYAAWALDAIGGVTPSYVPMRLREDLRSEERSRDALIELRRLGHALLDRRTAEGPVIGITRPSSAVAVGSLLSPPPKSTFAAAASARQAVRTRLERAVAGSRELFDRAPPAMSGRFGNSLREAVIPDDAPGLLRGRFSPLSDVREYWRLRPWEPAYREDHSGLVPLVATEDWPTRDDAPALRDLVNDSDPAVRGLAIEALGVLALPEDLRRIGALLTDTSAAAPALARIGERSSGLRGTRAESALVPMAWSDRTVGAYARAAVWLMTGRTFQKSVVFDTSFADWIDTHDLGWESLWYWHRRLARERNAQPVIDISPGEDAWDYSERRRRATDQHRAELRKQSAADLSRMTPDAQAKVYLLTDADIEWDSVKDPINDLFPDGFILGIERERILELLDGHNIWKDCLESRAESVLLWRLARLAPTMLPARDWPHVRDQLEARASGQPGMPVLVSRLLPAAKTGEAGDPGTREGYLRLSLARAAGDLRVKFIAEEMVRSNVEGQWAFLTARFNSNPSAGYWERLGVLDALVEPPHSREKLVALVAFVDDGRNNGFLTGRGEHFAELPGSRLAWGLYAIAGPAREDLPLDLRNVGRDLAKLQQLARLLLAQKGGAR